jgi:hypothetical protein
MSDSHEALSPTVVKSTIDPVNPIAAHTMPLISQVDRSILRTSAPFRQFSQKVFNRGVGGAAHGVRAPGDYGGSGDVRLGRLHRFHRSCLLN